MATAKMVEVTGVWLRNIGDKVQVLVEMGGSWRLAIEESSDGPFSHIVEPEGIRRAEIVRFDEADKPQISGNDIADEIETGEVELHSRAGAEPMGDSEHTENRSRPLVQSGGDSLPIQGKAEEEVRFLPREIWPDAALEKQMIEDVDLVASEFPPTSAGGDCACHVKSLLARVRELETALASKDAAFTKFISQAMTCKKSNTPEWMEYFAEAINTACAALGTEDRVKYPGRWSNEFKLESGG